MVVSGSGGSNYAKEGNFPEEKLRIKETEKKKKEDKVRRLKYTFSRDSRIVRSSNVGHE